MAALFTEQLQCMLDCLIDNNTHALGVFPADCIPIRGNTSNTGSVVLELSVQPCTVLRTDKNFCFILNTQPHGMPGEHWLAFFYNYATRRLEYFDSFGFPLKTHTVVYSELSRRHLTSFCESSNNQALQSMYSTVCGHYALLYLHERARKPLASMHNAVESHINTARTADARDKNILRRIYMLTRMHPCCFSSLFGAHRVDLSQVARTRASQSCRCARDCLQ
jgi:hypothetical protein